MICKNEHNHEVTNVHPEHNDYCFSCRLKALDDLKEKVICSGYDRPTGLYIYRIKDTDIIGYGSSVSDALLWLSIEYLKSTSEKCQNPVT